MRKTLFLAGIALCFLPFFSCTKEYSEPSNPPIDHTVSHKVTFKVYGTSDLNLEWAGFDYTDTAGVLYGYANGTVQGNTWSQDVIIPAGVKKIKCEGVAESKGASSVLKAQIWIDGVLRAEAASRFLESGQLLFPHATIELQ